MEQVKEQVGFSTNAHREYELTEKVLQEISKTVIETAKQTNTYMVVSDENGNIKKIPAKDL